MAQPRDDDLFTESTMTFGDHLEELRSCLIRAFLGLLIVILLQIIVYISALFLSVMGFVKALFGERWVMPFFGSYSERVPLI